MQIVASFFPCRFSVRLCQCKVSARSLARLAGCGNRRDLRSLILPDFRRQCERSIEAAIDFRQRHRLPINAAAGGLLGYHSLSCAEVCSEGAERWLIGWGFGFTVVIAGNSNDLSRVVAIRPVELLAVVVGFAGTVRSTSPR